MNTLNKKMLVIVFALMCFSCGKQNPRGARQGVDGAIGNENTLSCSAAVDATSCVLSLDAKTLGKLKNTLKAYGANGSWPVELLDTQSFNRRYPMRQEEKSCLKNAICKKVAL